MLIKKNALLLGGCSLLLSSFNVSAVNATYPPKTSAVEASHELSLTEPTAQKKTLPTELTSVSVSAQRPNLSFYHPGTDKNPDYLLEQTYTILGLSVLTAGLMTALPESITKWERDSNRLRGIAGQWKNNALRAPVWDRDEHFLNYISHPYFGGVYYTAARHAGYDESQSFLYSFAMSTLFWEYGVESFAEKPSWQDIIITPLFGAFVGEWMLDTEQNIIADGGQVASSQTLGDVSLFLLNPVGKIHHWISDFLGNDTSINFTTTQWLGNQDAEKFALKHKTDLNNQFYGLEVEVRFK